ncbi:uncharacterized protein EV420DRAFT_1477588 [Desarmillaria tabescens]|uniref:Uncharacterized protein n=1 Tax=Armillaria tabescens TaxID=1929756 RepID=A0AA39NA96_ARMTA|nr:uncharacterized protein EV420DRAFT_1477588 [Desarmillaria tabescens]KAK0461869.1 hypothetical protein EV420DRAFT_1477588 [Desarmillaria tabescens]
MGLEKCRAQALNPATTTEFFKLLKEISEKYDIAQENIYNMDEKGIQLGIGKRVLALVDRDQKEVYQVEDGNRELPVAATQPSLLVLREHNTADPNPNPEPAELPLTEVTNTHARQFRLASNTMMMPRPAGASRSALLRENAELRKLMEMAAFQMEKDYTQKVLMDQENERIRGRLFQKINKPLKKQSNAYARHMTSEESLQQLAEEDWKAKMKIMFTSHEWKEWKTKCATKRKEMALEEKEKEKEAGRAERAALKEKRANKKAEEKTRKAEEKAEQEREKAMEKERKALARTHAMQKKKQVQERAKMEKAIRSLAAKEAKAAAAAKLAMKKTRLRSRKQTHTDNEEGINDDSADTHDGRKEMDPPGVLPTSSPVPSTMLKPRPRPRPLHRVAIMSGSQPTSPTSLVLQHLPSTQKGPPKAILTPESEADGSCSESLASSGPRRSSRAKKVVKR